jgi:FkbM family methyltransferase
MNDLTKQIKDARQNVIAIQALGDGGNLLDLGANIGEVSIHCAPQFDKVFAVEAHPDTCEILKARVPDKVTVINAAAAAESGLIRFASSPSPCATGCTVRDTKRRKAEGYYKEVVTMSFDSLMKASRARLIKMDIEGSEYECLDGAIIPDHVKVIVVEFHNLTNEARRRDLQAIVDGLAGQGFSTRSPLKLNPNTQNETVIFVRTR